MMLKWCDSLRQTAVVTDKVTALAVNLLLLTTLPTTTQSRASMKNEGPMFMFKGWVPALGRVYSRLRSSSS